MSTTVSFESGDRLTSRFGVSSDGLAFKFPQTLMKCYKKCRRDSTSSTPADEETKDYTSPRTARETLSLAVEELSIHGINHVLNNRNNPFSIFWMVVLALCFFGILFASETYIQEFRNRRIYSETELRWSSELPMPSFTICNKVFFSRKKLEAMNIDPTTYNVMMALVSPPFLSNFKLGIQGTSMPTLEVADAKIKTLMANYNLTFKELVREVSYSCEELLLGCSMNRRLFTGVECCSQMIAIPTTSGLCHTYYASEVIHQRVISDFMGIILYIKVPQNDTPELPKGLKMTSLIEKGIQVSVMSRTTHPASVVMGHGALVSPSFVSFLEVSASEKNKKDEKVSFFDYNIDPCVPGDKIVYTENRSQFMNTQTNCFFWTINECALQLCHCSFYGTDPVDELSICGALEALECFKKMALIEEPASNSETRPTEDIFDSCYNERMSVCKTVCSEITFTYTTARTSFNNLYNHEGLGNFSFEKDTGVVNIFYGNFDYPYTKTWREGFTDFISKQGGQMGLFLGCSIISIIEVIVFILLIFCAACRSCLRKLREAQNEVYPVRASKRVK